ncbi:MAG TPA: exodeoxyribonuclease VII small subunit [Thauera sp.]|jgi:exodeoxyribonuclease VII small subunit|nr:exodeoxyribonuclease VII small subunit [Thauera sp.]HRA82449.1 exodeoxyribonuclease VII small subunit [Thauera sp.]
MPKSAPPPKSFEAAVSELEAIVQEMESGKLPLEEALARYQRGVGLLRFCQGTLADAEQRVKVLEGETLIDFAGEGKQP